MHILCLNIPAPSASLEKYAPHLTAEALHTWGLYINSASSATSTSIKTDPASLFCNMTKNIVGILSVVALAL